MIDHVSLVRLTHAVCGEQRENLTPLVGFFLLFWSFVAAAFLKAPIVWAGILLALTGGSTQAARRHPPKETKAALKRVTTRPGTSVTEAECGDFSLWVELFSRCIRSTSIEMRSPKEPSSCRHQTHQRRPPTP